MSSDISELMKSGVEHHQSGRLQEAEAAYRAVLKEQPRNADALHLLGVLALQVGKGDAAVSLIENAIEIRPNEPEFYNMCGEAYWALGERDAAIERYEQALALKPGFAGAHNNLGNAYKELGRLDDAIGCYLQAIAISPDFAMSHNNLGVVFKNLGRTDDAVAHYRKALSIAPNYAEAHTNLGNALQEVGRPEDAIAHHEKALAVRPDYAEAHSNLGNALKALGRPSDAVTHYEQALAIKPDFAMAHYNLGIALDDLGRPEEAVARYETALAIEPDYAEAHNNLANALDELGRQEDAVAHYQKALTIKPDYAEAHRHLAKLKPELERVSLLQKLLEEPAATDIDAMHYQFALGDIHHDAARFDEAFEHYDKANALKRGAISYDAQQYSDYADRLIEGYSQDYFQGIAAIGSDSELPVFIIGMPRSGTTLIEQIVSSHPEVYGAGELAVLGNIERAIVEEFATLDPYPSCMRSHSQSIVPRAARQYLEEIVGRSDGEQRVTDKAPGNFARIGLIKTLFPEARIIHCRRDALDTCTSIYLNYFVEGQDYAYELTELGQHYLDYEKLMAHWESLFPSGILGVHYEELVTEQEAVSRRLIEYLGLEWDVRCLDFHENKRAVRTASSAQVRRPMYTHSISRWKQYEKHLAPLIAMLSQ